MLKKWDEEDKLEEIEKSKKAKSTAGVELKDLRAIIKQFPTSRLKKMLKNPGNEITKQVIWEELISRLRKE